MSPRTRWGIKGRPQAERREYTAEETEAAERAFASGRPYNRLVWLTNHCTDEYRERFRPELAPGEAKGELYRRLRDEGVFAIQPPAWHVSSNKSNIGYVVIGDDIILPIRPDQKNRAPYVAITCLWRTHQ